ncbi:hypothetical protein AB0J01_27855 [Streptomyces sp. NPDC050204]|uniref:hypothetical protein n=1 Tax=Streptomyces sp. NPDC050204 TaxID=3155514 RepID=UPI003423D8D1
MSSEPTTDENENDDTGQATVQPAAAWPVFEEGHAQAEMAALHMLCNGASLRSIRLRTRLTYPAINRLALVVAEEAKNPARPRNVLRDRRPARIRGAKAPPPPAPEPEQLEADIGPAATPPKQPETPSTVTEQLPFLF